MCLYALPVPRRKRRRRPASPAGHAARRAPGSHHARSQVVAWIANALRVAGMALKGAGMAVVRTTGYKTHF
eukprot:353654-Chlamydomonas_euryale.AAC.7